MAIPEDQDSRQPQIPEQSKHLEHNIVVLQERIDMLASRLEPVLRDSVPQVDDKKTEEPNLAILADTLRGLCGGTEKAQHSIEDLIDRLEL